MVTKQFRVKYGNDLFNVNMAELIPQLWNISYTFIYNKSSCSKD